MADCIKTVKLVARQTIKIYECGKDGRYWQSEDDDEQERLDTRTLVVQWCEAAVIVGPEGGIIKDLELSTGARIKVETGKVKYKGTRIVALLIAQVKGGNQWSDGSGNFLENQVLERNNE